MKTLVCLLLYLLSAATSYCQIEEPFIYGWGEETKIKGDSLGTYYKMGKDKIFYVNNKPRFYRIFDDKYHLLEEGEIGKYCVDCPARAGRCTSYYPDGKIKARGFYNYRGEPIGTWQSYYSNAELRELLTYDAGNPGKKIGSYEANYQNGRSEVIGFYCITYTYSDSTIVDTINVVNPHTGEIKTIISTNDYYRSAESIRCGQWSYYNEHGDLIKREDLDN